MEGTVSTRSENYQVTIDFNNNAFIERYNYPNLVACIYDRIKRTLRPQLTRFKALPEQSIIDVNALEIKIREEINRIEISDKKTGVSNWIIGFLR